MSGSGRSQLHALRLERAAAALGGELLDDKREAILRALLDRTRRRQAAAERVRELLGRATAALRDARIEMGSRAVEAAALAQPVDAAVEWRAGSVVGVPTPHLVAGERAFSPRYAPAGTSAKLDDAGVEFSALLPAIVRFAEEDEAVRNLQSGLSRTVHRLKALEEVVIPRLGREFRNVTVALEEEERDDTVRRQVTVSGRTSWRCRLSVTG